MRKVFLLLALILSCARITHGQAGTPVTIRQWYLLNECADLNSGDKGAYSPSQVHFSYHNATITMTNSGAPFTCGFSHAQGPTITGTGTTTQSYLSGSLMWHDLNFAPTSGNPVTYIVSAKLALGWPSIWLLGGNKAANTGCQPIAYYTWDNYLTCNWDEDTDDSGEIDFQENTAASGTITNTLQNIFNGTSGPYTGTSQTISSATANFHAFYVTVGTTQICFGIDGVQSACTSGVLVTRPMFMIIENRVNGSSVPSFPQTMTIQYAQVCQGVYSACTPDTAGGTTLFLDDMNGFHYVRAGASGTGDGSSWTNACTDFTGSCAPSLMVRGDTYYVGTGTYSNSTTFNTAASGTLPITILGATASDHGPATDWSNSYGVDAAQATFNGSLTFSTSYWDMDGNTSTPLWSQTASQYGFFNSQTSGGCGGTGPMNVYNTGSAITNITVAHFTATGTASDVAKCWLSTNNSTQAVSNVTISNVFLNNWGNCFWATSPGLTMDSWVFQYSVDLNGASTATNHGECVNNNFGAATNWVVAFNWFQGPPAGGSCQTGKIVANNNNNTNISVYGNVFYNTIGCNGIITGTSAGNLVSPHVYNNTFVSCPQNPGSWIGGNITGTPVVQNNLLFSMPANSGAPGGDYNAYFQTTGPPSETHGQVSSANPFVNSSAQNYALVAETSAGITLSSPYNVDATGTARPGSDGIWSRGALQYTTGGPPTRNLSESNTTIDSLIEHALHLAAASQTGTTVDSVAKQAAHNAALSETNTCRDSLSTSTQSSGTCTGVILTSPVH